MAFGSIATRSYVGFRRAAKTERARKLEWHPKAGDRVTAYGDFYPYVVTEVSDDGLSLTLKDHLGTTSAVPRDKVDYVNRRR